MIRIALPCIALMLASCGSHTPSTSSTEENANSVSSSIIDFEKASWRLTSIKIEDETFIVEGEEITLNLDLTTGDYNGKSACNSYFGQAEKIEADKLLFSPGGMTEMMCEENVMLWESRYLMSLMEHEFIVNIQKDVIMLNDVDNGSILSFTPILTEE